MRPQNPPLALREVIESEIRAIARREGVDGHRQCLRKFLELLLARGARLIWLQHAREHGLSCLQLACCLWSWEDDVQYASDLASAILFTVDFLVFAE